MKKVLVFDMDGTLLDSMEMWSNLLNDLENKKHIIKDLKPFYAEEGSMIDYCYQLIKKKFKEYDRLKMYRFIHEHLEKFYLNEDLCKSNVYNKLEELQKDDYDMYVATATDFYYANLAINSNGLDRFIKGIFTPDKLDHSKESLDYFKGFSDRLGVKPSDIIFFDDALYANINANKLGMKTIGVYDENSTSTKDLKEEVDYFINNFNEINDEILS